MIFAGCCSFIGSIVNKDSVITLNGCFYIFGILILSILIADSLYNLHSKGRISRLRIAVKASLLAGATSNPLYLITLAIVADFVLLILEYRMIANSYVCPKSWLMMNISAELALLSFFFVPDSLLTIGFTMAFILLTIPFEFFMTYH